MALVIACVAKKCNEVSQGALAGCIARRPIQQEAQGSPGGRTATSPISVLGSRNKTFDRPFLAPSPRRRPSARCLNRQVINEARREQLRRPRSRCNRSRSYVMFQFALFYSALSDNNRSLASTRARHALARSLIASRLSLFPRGIPPLRFFPASSALLVNDSSIHRSEGVSATPP